MAVRYDNAYNVARPCGCVPAEAERGQRCPEGDRLAERARTLVQGERPPYPLHYAAQAAYLRHLYDGELHCDFCPAWSFETEDIAVVGERERDDSGTDVIRTCRMCWEKVGREVGWLPRERARNDE